MDSKILSIAKKNDDIGYYGKTYGWSNESALEGEMPKMYKEFQEAVSDYCSLKGWIPLDFDYYLYPNN